MDTVPELHDARRVWHFWIDDQVIDTYGQKIGPYGIAIYAYLARRAKLGSAFPSHGRIAKDIHCSRDTVIRILKKLQAVALISIEPRYTESGDPDTNLYTILDLSHLHTQGSSSQQQGSSSQQQGSSSQQQGSSSQQQGSSCEQGRVVAVSREGSSCEQHEVFSLKDTQEKEKDIPPTPLPLAALASPPGGKHARKKKAEGLRTDYTPGFQKWWQHYPADRRYDKPLCFAVWLAHSLEARTDEQVEKLERLKETTWKHCERKHVKTALPYLNGGRFEDDLVPLPDIPTQQESGLSEKGYRSALASIQVMEELARDDARRQTPFLSITRTDE